MKKLLAAIAAVGTIVAGFASTACLVIVIDEPTLPNALIK